MYAFKSGFAIAAWLVVMHGAPELPFSSAATCVEREDQIQGYLISSEPPFDNYYNISKAVYPSVDLPSLLIKVTVRFLATADYILIHQNGSSRSLNVNNVSTTEADVLQTTGNETRTNDTNEFTWSASCLYVSGGDISMTAMNFFSLFAIWPNRRERRLHISLPQFCKGYSSDTMIYFLSTVGIFPQYSTLFMHIRTVASRRRTEALARVKFYQILSIFIFFIRLIILEDFIRLISYNGPCVRLGCSFFLATALHMSLTVALGVIAHSN